MALKGAKKIKAECVNRHAHLNSSEGKCLYKEKIALSNLENHCMLIIALPRKVHYILCLSACSEKHQDSIISLSTVCDLQCAKSKNIDHGTS